MKKANVWTESVHGIPFDDAQMATYAAYYVGANAKDPTVGPLSNKNTDIDGRGTNVMKMTQPLEDYFSKPGSPFIVIDDSNRWLERHGKQKLSEQQKEIGNGYFVTLYHKESGKVMVVFPGMENDTPGSGTNNISHNATGMLSRAFGDVADIALNAEDNRYQVTHLRQVRSLNEYLGELKDDMQRGNIEVSDGGRTRKIHLNTKENFKDHVVIAGHSSGTIPAMTMAGMGYDTFMVEPRAYDKNLQNKLLNNVEYLTHQKMDPATFRGNLDKHEVSIRSAQPNIWNSGMNVEGKFQSETFGKNYVAYVPGSGNKKDDMIGGMHREEVMTPDLLGFGYKDAKGVVDEKLSAKGYTGHAFLIADAIPGSAVSTFGEKLTVPKVDPVMPQLSQARVEPVGP